MKYGLIVLMSVLSITFFYNLIVGLMTAERIEVIERQKQNRLIKVFIFTEKSINESNIKYYIKHYNSFLHFALAISCYMLSYGIIKTYPIEFRVLLSLIAFQIPWVMLQFVKARTTAEIKKQILDLMISFKAYYILKKDIFQAFSLLEGNLSEPIGNTVEVLNKQYLITKREGEKCLISFIKRFSDLKMKLFVEQLILAYKTGGDVESICTKFIQDMRKYEELEDKEKLDGLSDRYGLYFLIIMNLAMMHYMMDRNYAFIRFVTYNMVGKAVLIIDYVICILLLVKLIKDR